MLVSKIGWQGLRQRLDKGGAVVVRREGSRRQRVQEIRGILQNGRRWGKVGLESGQMNMDEEEQNASSGNSISHIAERGIERTC